MGRVAGLLLLGAAIRASSLTRESAGRAGVTGSYGVPQQATGSSAPEASRPVN